jgi:probable rRNA maturation factor
VDVSTTLARLPLPKSRVRALVTRALELERIRNALVSVTFLGPRAMANLNSSYLGQRGPTDVITFSFDRESPRLPVVGDIYVCSSVAAANAKRLRISLREELSRLVVHGTLHLAGLDHPDDDTRTSSPMWRKQERIVDRDR